MSANRSSKAKWGQLNTKGLRDAGKIAFAVLCRTFDAYYDVWGHWERRLRPSWEIIWSDLNYATKYELEEYQSIYVRSV